MSIDWIPARQIGPKERGNRGFIPSGKNPAGIVEYESCLERDFYLLCNHAPDVLKFQHQPITIDYLDKNGKKRRYTPDVYVEYKDHRRGLYEIKYEEEIIEKHQEYEERWVAAEAWAKENSLEFAILSEKQIKNTRKANVWFTLGASKCASNDKYTNKITNLLAPEGEEYNSICIKLSETLGVEVGKAAQILCYMIYHGLVFVDTFSNKELSRDTIIRPRQESRISPFRDLRDDLNLDNNPSDKSMINDHESEPINLMTKPSAIYDEEVKRREIIVKAWLNQPSQKRTVEWRDDFCDKWDISKSTMYR